jgi:hypothetical protein
LARPSKFNRRSRRASVFIPLRALLFIAGLVSVTLAQPAAGSTAGDIANQPVSGSLEDLASSIEHEHPLAAFERQSACGKRGERTKPFSFSIWGNFGFALIC